MMRLEDSSIDTETFLLPGQQLYVGTPQDRDGTVRPKGPSARNAAGSPLDAESDSAVDPCAGWEIGPYEVIRRLSPESLKTLLAVRDGASLAVLKRLEIPDHALQGVLTHCESVLEVGHENLAKVWGCEVSGQGVFWATEFVPGATLWEISVACRKLGKAMPLGLALAAVHEAALALGAVHARPGFAHGLVSSQSVLASFSGTTKLLDMGFLKCIESGRSSSTAWLRSMAPYLAPEQFLRGHAADPRCDVFSLGVVLYECLSGRRLFDVKSLEERAALPLTHSLVRPSQVNIALDPELDEVVLKAVNHDRALRYATGRELASALKQVAAPFMWRSSQRASFVADLFGTRQRREQVLLAGCAQAQPRTQRPEIKRAAVVYIPPPRALPPPLPRSDSLPEATVIVGSQIGVSAVGRVPPTAYRTAIIARVARPATASARVPVRRAYWLALVAVALVGIAQADLPFHDPALVGEQVAALFSRRTVESAKVTAPPAPPAAAPKPAPIELGSDGIIEPALETEQKAEAAPQEASASEVRSKAVSRAKLLKRKKAAEPPLPPWLAPKRGRDR